jgi:DNA-binding protein HU-beta
MNREEGTTMAAKAKRTTLRSSANKKLYAVRDAKGKFKDIQSYKRAQGQDVKRSSKAERTA